ncbi:hypothetical protein PC114_g9815 [Phytophthora cactorum]|uniref:Arrestin-like N-terminal domain-containing protein n=1 Tax=Phytophthora cactorum TaxID=29920 RepID=A0A8T1DTU1_9STRA|nr:hypothetical protein PC114_g9815 [Phytophthora cactorum]KAG2925534.1 hypothetical protein PC115_g8217 [Phytophthora cactorum]KAG2942983.1 hypothetical protein PC117_g9581 [Phytophthora cactorum]KAG3173440.1 hypothetical protein PC128_g18279 [Phytophthora cactorum]
MAKRESVEGVLGRLTIALEHESYASGEVVAGTVKLSTLELVQAREPLAVIVQGREEVAWDEGGYSPVTNAFDKIFLQHKIDLTLSTLYNASESEYRFSFQLPTDLPSSFELIDVYSGTAERLRVRVKYQATVWLRADSDSVAYLNAEQEFTVHAPPTITPPVQSLEILASEVVHWLCCINRGSLQMMIEIPKDVYPAGEVIPLQCRVDGSACKVSIKSTSVELVEDILLRNLGERADWTVTRVLSTQHVEGPSAGQTGEQTLRVGLVENEKENIVAEVPVRVLHHNTSFSAGANRVCVRRLYYKKLNVIDDLQHQLHCLEADVEQLLAIYHQRDARPTLLQTGASNEEPSQNSLHRAYVELAQVKSSLMKENAELRRREASYVAMAKGVARLTAAQNKVISIQQQEEDKRRNPLPHVNSCRVLLAGR